MSRPPADTSPRFFWPALICALLGLSSVAFLLLIVTGLPALVFGLYCIRTIHRSEGRLTGVSWAFAGMILGGIGTVISASGFVLGLTMEAREHANRLACQNHLRLIGESMALYQDKAKAYPPATLPPAAWPIEQRWSWLASIRPYLHQEDKTRPSREMGVDWTKLDLNLPWTAEANRAFVNTSILEFTCPSNPNRAATGSPAWTDYVGFAGLGPDAARLPLEDQNAGFFGFDRTLTRQQLAQWRGSSLTAMATETALENGPWAAGGQTTVRSLDPALRPFLGPGRLLGGCHKTGLNVLFADGSVMFFLNSYESAKLEALVTIHAE